MVHDSNGLEIPPNPPCGCTPRKRANNTVHQEKEECGERDKILHVSTWISLVPLIGSGESRISS
jgi:hypothetical protein